MGLELSLFEPLLCLSKFGVSLSRTLLATRFLGTTELRSSRNGLLISLVCHFQIFLQLRDPRHQIRVGQLHLFEVTSLIRVDPSVFVDLTLELILLLLQLHVQVADLGVEPVDLLSEV